MSLSARDQRILSEIAHELAAGEPRLARALTRTRLPVLRRRPLVAGGQQRHGAWIAAILASLLAGIALLTAGLVLGILALACAGAVMTQFSPAALGYLRARRRGSQLGRPAAPRGHGGR
jgi:hypothetical protein